MLTQNQLESKRQQYKAIGDKIEELTKREDALSRELIEDAIERVKLRFHNVKIGDKVVVKYREPWLPEEADTQEETLFLKGFSLCYYCVYQDMTAYVLANFYKIKHDGTPSKLTRYVENHSIISIEKVDG